MLIPRIISIGQKSAGSWLKGMKLDEFPSSDTCAFFCLLLKPHPQKKRKFYKKKEEKRLENKIIKQQMNDRARLQICRCKSYFLPIEKVIVYFP